MRDFFFDDPFFKNSWEDFDKVRDAMFTESRDMWKKFDEDFRNMACMSNNIMLESPARGAITSEEQTSAPRSLMRQDSKSRWENGWMFPRRWMLPALNTDFPNHTDIFKSKDTEVIRVKEDESKLEVSLDTSQYRPDERSVSVSDGVLRVEGKHEEKAEDGTVSLKREPTHQGMVGKRKNRHNCNCAIRYRAFCAPSVTRICSGRAAIPRRGRLREQI